MAEFNSTPASREKSVRTCITVGNALNRRQTFNCWPGWIPVSIVPHHNSSILFRQMACETDLIIIFIIAYIFILIIFFCIYMCSSSMHNSKISASNVTCYLNQPADTQFLHCCGLFSFDIVPRIKNSRVTFCTSTWKCSYSSVWFVKI